VGGPLARRAQGRIDWLAKHPQVVVAARIAKTFRQDPVVMLRDGGDFLVTLVRAAAYQVVQADEKAAEAEMKRRQPKR
jgi:hypothetical protein